MARRGRNSVGMHLKMGLIIASFVGGFKVFPGIIIASKGKKKQKRQKTKKVKQLQRELISFIESKHPPTRGPAGHSSWHLAGCNKWADTFEKPDRATRMSEATISPAICASPETNPHTDKRAADRRNPSVRSDLFKVDCESATWGGASHLADLTSAADVAEPAALGAPPAGSRRT